jgi:hypothetical protein
MRHGFLHIHKKGVNQFMGMESPKENFGSVNERNVCRIRSNKELRCTYQDLDLVTTIRKSR